MLPGQIGLLILGLASVLVLAVLGVFSWRAWKKEKERAARRARRKPLLEPEPIETPAEPAAEYAAWTPLKEETGASDAALFFDDAAHAKAPTDAKQPEHTEPSADATSDFASTGELDWSFLEEIKSTATAVQDNDDETPPVSFDFKF